MWGRKREFWSDCSSWIVLFFLQTVHDQFWWICIFYLQVDGFIAYCCWFALWDILHYQGKSADCTKESSPQPKYTSMCFDPTKSSKFHDDVYTQCNALYSTSEELSLKALELINALKFDKLNYPTLSTFKIQWIDAFFKLISRQQVVTSIQSCLQSLKLSFLDEINPIISQMEWESVSYTIEVLQSFHIIANKSDSKESQSNVFCAWFETMPFYLSPIQVL